MRSIALATHTISSAVRDGARVFHHVGDELAQDRAELLVDAGVVADHLGRAVAVEPREAVERAAQHRDRRPRPRVALRRPAAPAVPPRSWMFFAMRAIFCASSPMRSRSVTILHDRDDQAQVARRRLAAHDDLAAVARRCATSSALTRSSASITCVGRAPTLPVRERVDRARGSATRPARPSASTRVRIASRSASNCLEACSVMPLLFIRTCR